MKRQQQKMKKIQGSNSNKNINSKWMTFLLPLNNASHCPKNLIYIISSNTKKQSHKISVISIPFFRGEKLRHTEFK